MYEILIYPITPDLWRWEIRCDESLLYCGTSHSEEDAEKDVNQVAGAA